MRIQLCVIGLMLVAFSACSKLDVYEKTAPFPSFEWNSAFKPQFTFTITDTNSLYNIYVVVRHEDSYHYNNLWVNVTTKAPNTPATTQQLEIILASNGKGWLGSGIDDIFSHRIRITQAPVKLKKGDYYFSLQQIMRENPLQSVLNAGIRVEKVAP